MKFMKPFQRTWKTLLSILFQDLVSFDCSTTLSVSVFVDFQIVVDQRLNFYCNYITNTEAGEQAAERAALL